MLLVWGAVSRGLRVTLFTGYTPEEINESEVMSNIVAQCHTVIMGRYRKDLPCSDVLKASSNQVVLGDTTGVVDAELHLDLDTGRMVITGVRWARMLKRIQFKDVEALVAALSDTMGYKTVERH